uniref:Uncharacterized protein n=1 Tax=Tupiella akineta TaxID=160070 RepID=Q6UVR7_TUPAK|nr:hypothetical protein PsakpMp45 [Tupiella akineta]AAQ18757.1 hypothetical protein [Tupiella akineta]
MPARKSLVCKCNVNVLPRSWFSVYEQIAAAKFAHFFRSPCFSAKKSLRILLISFANYGNEQIFCPLPQFAKAPSHFALPPKLVFRLRTNCRSLSPQFANEISKFCCGGKICSLHSQTAVRKVCG